MSHFHIEQMTPRLPNTRFETSPIPIAQLRIEQRSVLMSQSAYWEIVGQIQEDSGSIGQYLPRYNTGFGLGCSPESEIERDAN
jgi:hypothetical protein